MTVQELKDKIVRLENGISSIKKEYREMSTKYVIASHEIDRLNAKIKIYKAGGIGSQLLNLIDA